MLTYDALAVTLEDANGYATARLRAWVGSDPDKLAALRRGQDYIAGRYNARWLVEWTVPPLTVGYAIFEAAIRELAAPGSLSPDYTGTQRVLSETVGPISVTYANSAGLTASQPVVTVIEDLLREHIAAKTIFLERA